MRATGIVRKIDELGRVVIPKEIRTSNDYKKRDPIEIFVDKDMVIIQKYYPACSFCGTKEKNQDNTVELAGKTVCKTCVSEITAN